MEPFGEAQPLIGSSRLAPIRVLRLSKESFFEAPRRLFLNLFREAPSESLFGPSGRLGVFGFPEIVLNRGSADRGGCFLRGTFWGSITKCLPGTL